MKEVAQLKARILELTEENEFLKTRESRWRKKYLNLVIGCLCRKCKVMEKRIESKL